MFAIYVVLVALLTAASPFIVKRAAAIFPGIKLYPSYNWLPAVAALLFIAAIFIPDIHISSETNTFQQHFVGGGFYMASLYVYFKKLLGWKFNWPVSLLVLFAWASAFGVTNELIEFATVKLNISHITINDTEWDLLANTLGAFVGYFTFLIAKLEKTN